MRKLGSFQTAIYDLIPASWIPKYVLLLSIPGVSYSRIIKVLERLEELNYIESRKSWLEIRRIK